MNSTAWLNPVFSLLAILATVAGLAIAGLLLPNVVSWIRSERIRALLSRPFARLVLWVGLGALFSFPLKDFLIGLSSLVQIVSASSIPFTTTLGTVSLQAFSGFTLILLIAVYGCVYWLSRNCLKSETPLDRTGRFFIISSAASLAYRGINDLLSFIFSISLPLNTSQDYGFTGFAVQWLIGLVLFAAILVGLNSYLPSHPLSSHK